MAGHLGPRDLESGHVVPSGGHVEFRNIGGNFNFLGMQLSCGPMLSTEILSRQSGIDLIQPELTFLNIL